MNSKIKLGICIPTYNRGKKLERCLKSILRESLNSDLDIYIYISDNASIDNTEEIVKTYQKKYKKIFYKKNNRNLGLDKNMFASLEMSKQEYNLWLGDDDILVEGCFSAIKKELSKDYELLILNRTSYDSQKNISIANILGIDKDEEYDVNEEFIKKYSDKLTFGTIIVKNYLKEIKIDKYLGSLHAYSEYIWEYLSKKEKSKVKILSKDCVKWEAGSGKEYEARLIELYLNKICNMKYPEKYKKVFEKINREHLKKHTNLKKLFYLRLLSKDVSDIKREEFPKLTMFMYMKLKFVYLIPQKIFNWIFKIRDFMKKRGE